MDQFYLGPWLNQNDVLVFSEIISSLKRNQVEPGLFNLAFFKKVDDTMLNEIDRIKNLIKSFGLNLRSGSSDYFMNLANEVCSDRQKQMDGKQPENEQQANEKIRENEDKYSKLDGIAVFKYLLDQFMEKKFPARKVRIILLVTCFIKSTIPIWYYFSETG